MATPPTAAPPDQPPADDPAPLGDKHELVTRPGDLIQRVPLSKAVAQYVLSDDEIRRTYRLASALATSGMYKDGDGRVTAEQAFAKILIGQDLGISATRALAGLDIVRGNIQMRGVLLLAFVRQSRTYDYRIIELDGETEVEGTQDVEKREAKQRATLRFFEVAPDGTKEALHPDITFTMSMARKQGNVKDKSPWYSARRNMLLWRAASDGVKFHCPDLLGGIPIYTEADSFPEPKSLSTGQGDEQAAGLDLGPEVEAVIARANDLGHAALADRATVEMTLGDQPPAKVVAWVKAANRELDAIPQDAEVVEPQERVLQGNTAQAAEPAREADNAPQAPPETPELHAKYVRTEYVYAGAASDPERIAALRRRVADLQDDAAQMEADGDPRAEKVREEADLIAATIEAETDLSQTALGF